MTTPIPDLLRLAQWLSPAFPTSGYAYSHGLESAVAEGRVCGADGTARWVEAVLRHGSGALDAWALRRAMAGDADRATAILRARAGCAERWEETRAQGAAFVATTTAMGMAPLPDAPLPVAVGLRAAGMAPEPVCALYLQAFAAQLVSAAARLLPLGQSAAQRIVASLHPVVGAVAAAATDDQPGAAALAAELDAMRHETLQPRVFRT